MASGDRDMGETTDDARPKCGHLDDDHYETNSGMSGSAHWCRQC